jgi:Outer membrane protein beta-barrel domain
MKKILTVTLLFISTFAFSQRFHFGLKAGANVSNFTGGDFNGVDKKALVGFHGGLFGGFSVGQFGIQTEATVSTQGAKLDSISGNGSTQWKLTYINLPVMFQFMSEVGFFVELGPQVGFKISEDIGGQTIDNFAKDLDFSVAGGLGFKGKSGFGIGGRYNLGISKIGNIPSSTSTINPDFKNAVIQVSLYVPLTR